MRCRTPDRGRARGIRRRHPAFALPARPEVRGGGRRAPGPAVRHRLDGHDHHRPERRSRRRGRSRRVGGDLRSERPHRTDRGAGGDDPVRDPHRHRTAGGARLRVSLKPRSEVSIPRDSGSRRPTAGNPRRCE